ncbi:hypothetical protein CPB83DRAFT_92268 [Crepidotus variabilis]|uniref:Uncharacterized protein n=1 Tax=Crepidotus variabilis TaxID=179855 RepID=A0A9P6JIV6_9AGAR|nr:hypothetical protein CPB83DRAFT_92268 [Crepidotus variabilis]
MARHQRLNYPRIFLSRSALAYCRSRSICTIYGMRPWHVQANIDSLRSSNRTHLLKSRTLKNVAHQLSLSNLKHFDICLYIVYVATISLVNSFGIVGPLRG